MIYRLAKKKNLKAEINVVPYIDVMLVLLIIFMVLSPLLIQGVEVDLPQTERIKELMQEGLSPEEIIMRGFSFEKVTEALKNGA